MRIELLPGVGAGPLRLGMTVRQIEQAAGSPRMRRRNTLGETEYVYDAVSVVFGGDSQRVVEVAVTPPARPQYKGRDMLGEEDAWKEAVRDDGNPYEYQGFIVLLSLGMTLTGVHDDDPSQKAVTVFAEGRWDGLRGRMRRFRPV